jgi:hypothetical protein
MYKLNGIISDSTKFAYHVIYNILVNIFTTPTSRYNIKPWRSNLSGQLVLRFPVFLSCKHLNSISYHHQAQLKRMLLCFRKSFHLFTSRFSSTFNYSILYFSFTELCFIIFNEKLYIAKVWVCENIFIRETLQLHF